MRRRTALQQLASATVGLITLPAWANGWNQNSLLTGKSGLIADQRALLAEIAETIIPATDTPGAKALGVGDFIQKMVTDCYEPAAQQTLTKGLASVDELAKQRFSKSFLELDSTQRTDLLNQMSQSTDSVQKDFFSLVKNLTIRGYMSSEYVLTNLTHYEMVPGRYHGCVPVSSKTVSEKK